ncbi:hypothetical protein [Marinivivus vitaminiproducens]|uniref:hypothetical protein n=1 Tax=Marinivivus vitaminiproducens TaxID=3035935 RepID=UPI00279F1DFE|nr:hypothetical protein P4R82_10785 [Geminicoccaceae bacterium SCSIO 64248]
MNVHPRLRAGLRRAKPWLLGLVLLTGVTGFVQQIAAIVERNHANQMIAGLLAGRDVAIDDEAPSDVVLARAFFRTRRGQVDAVPPLLDIVTRRGHAAVRATMLYDTANARMRLAFDHLERNEIDEATPLINLAKDEYRATLRIAPGHWNAKHNLDVAMRLIRDFPVAEDQEGDEEPEQPERLWTDLPGVPRGLP